MYPTKYSEAIKLGITWTVNNLPILQGIGENSIIPVGLARITIEIGNISETIDAYVDDSVIRYEILIGQNFTEQPGIVIVKTAESLTIDRNPSTKLSLILQNDTIAQPGESTIIPIYCDVNYSGNVYIRGSLRNETDKEYYLMPGKYEIRERKSRLIIQNISKNILELKQATLITRAAPSYGYRDVRMLELRDLKSDSILNYGEHLTNDEVIKLKNLLMKHKTCFSQSLKDLGFTNVTQMEIELTDTKPIVYRPYRLSAPERKRYEKWYRK